MFFQFRKQQILPGLTNPYSVSIIPDYPMIVKPLIFQPCPIISICRCLLPHMTPWLVGWVPKVLTIPPLRTTAWQIHAKGATYLDPQPANNIATIDLGSEARTAFTELQKTLARNFHLGSHPDKGRPGRENPGDRDKGGMAATYYLFAEVHSLSQLGSNRIGLAWRYMR
jgi:hypothetical protein